MTTIDQEFVEYLVKSLVENPDDVSIERIVDEKGVLLTLSVNDDDLGRVIGKRGATAQSIRTLLRALGTKNEARYNLKIADNGTAPPAKKDDDTTATDDGSWGDNDDNTKDEPKPPKHKKVKPTKLKRKDELEGSLLGTLNSTHADLDDSPSSTVQKVKDELADLDDLDI